MTGAAYYEWCVHQAADGTPYYTGQSGVIDHREAAEQRIAEARLKAQADQAEKAWAASETARKQRETLAEEEQKESEARATQDRKAREAQLEAERAERKAREDYENSTRAEQEVIEAAAFRERAQQLRYRPGSTVSDVPELEQLPDDEQGTSEYWMASQELVGDDDAASPGAASCCCY